MTHFNKLTPAEAERLAILNEECAEVQQIISKILRHGYESYHPDDETKTSNRELLEKELGDIELILYKMKQEKDVTKYGITEAFFNKYRKINKYLHHNKVELDITHNS